ncbi:ASCH domain-containing protein, partial [Escherichia coli]|uniref:ASCH domain-containing protein n=1 Tax=Escherichia coli TaxID=562 RepID=UPI0020777CB3
MATASQPTGCRCQQHRSRRLTVANLQLAVKGEYFDAMIRGEKTEEYRLCNDYWKK